MFKRLAHVCLHVRDLARSIAYYEKIGLTVRFRFTRKGAPYGAYLEIAEGNYVELFEEKGLDPVGRSGLAHFCFESDDIDALMVKLRERGVAFTDKALGCDHTYQIWLSDPDGNKFEVHQYTDASTQRTGGVVEVNW
jgi:lactoylglutathione lyase/glyoxylase I family protein